MAAEGAQNYLPDSPTADLGALTAAAQGCRGCHLYRDAGPTVFGEGRADAAMMLVGEQPGDHEDRAGRPFVGPSGQLLDKALAAADMQRDDLYVTNAVKHFKFARGAGQRRIHKTPSRTEVVACRPWLLAEIEAVAPDVLLLMGASAAQSLLGNDFRLTAHRGEVLRLPARVDGLRIAEPGIVVTVHPSSVLRGPPEARTTRFEALVDDLRFARRLVGGRAG